VNDLRLARSRSWMTPDVWVSLVWLLVSSEDAWCISSDEEVKIAAPIPVASLPEPQSP
jgi:hypothetical protein